MYDKTNVFANIINKKIHTELVYEDDLLLAFHDSNPVVPIHLLVVPKKEYTCYSDFIAKATPEEISHYFTKISHIAKIFDLDKTGYRLITNNGSSVGQTIFHFHFHIIGGKALSKLI